MRVAGKCPPSFESLRRTAARGFDAVELHLPEAYLDDPEATAAAVADAPLDVVSVHTPHVTIDDLGRVREADRLADRLDAYLVVHSQYLNHVHVPSVTALGLTALHGFENNPGISVRHLEATILAPGHELVLDTAHLYRAHEDYLDRIEYLLAEWGDAISVVHLCDSTLETDGLGFGEGEMDMAAVGRVLKESFDGTVVLEVMPDHQADALAAFESY